VLVSLPFARALVLLDGAAVSTDKRGNDVQVWLETVVAGCSWWPSSTTEAEPVGGSTVTSRYAFLMPESTVHAVSGRPPSPVDRVRLPDIAGVWQIDGDPRSHWSPITGVQGGLGGWLVRVTG
jgi:hypothetical protein